MSGYKRIDEFNDEITAKLKTYYTDILALIGEDPTREGLLNTPERVAKSMQYLTQGYDSEPSDILKSATLATLLNPVIKPLGIYAICARPINGIIWCSHIEYISISLTITIC